MKVIKISNCRYCPHFDSESAEMFSEGGMYCSNGEVGVKKLGSWNEYCKEKAVKIPKWCPLEDSK